MDQDTLPEWLKLALAVLGAGGIGAFGREIVQPVLKRDETRQSEETQYRHELRGAILELNERVDALQTQLDEARVRENRLMEENARLRAEHHLIRSREHQIRGYLAVLVGTAQILHKKLGLPEEDLPRVPEWLNEPVPGPTTGPSANGDTLASYAKERK